MSNVVLVTGLIGVALILVILFYLLSQDESNNYALKVILLAFILGIIVLIGKTAIDSKDNCGWVVTNSTTVGSTTTYNTDYVCSTNTNTTSSTFYNLTLWAMRLVTTYLILSFAFQLIEYFGWMKRGGKQE